MANKAKTPPDIRSHGQDLVQMVIGYVKQETFEPIRGLGRFLAFGLAGSLLVALGQLLFLLGVLRFLQVQTGSAFRGHLSFLPYFLTLLACGAVAGAALAARANPARKGTR